MQVQMFRFYVPEVRFNGESYEVQAKQFVDELTHVGLMVLDHGQVLGHWTDREGNRFEVPGHMYEVGFDADVQDIAAIHASLIQKALELFDDQPYVLTGEGTLGQLTPRT